MQKALRTFHWDYFSGHSSNLDTETEAVHDNYKSYD